MTSNILSRISSKLKNDGVRGLAHATLNKAVYATKLTRYGYWKMKGRKPVSIGSHAISISVNNRRGDWRTNPLNRATTNPNRYIPSTVSVRGVVLCLVMAESREHRRGLSSDSGSTLPDSSVCRTVYEPARHNFARKRDRQPVGHSSISP